MLRGGARPDSGEQKESVSINLPDKGITLVLKSEMPASSRYAAYKVAVFRFDNGSYSKLRDGFLKFGLKQGALASLEHEASVYNRQSPYTQSFTFQYFGPNGLPYDAALYPDYMGDREGGECFWDELFKDKLFKPRLSELSALPQKEKSDRICESVYMLLLAVAHMHSNKMTHLDIKSENVLIVHTKDGPVLKLVDFELSRNGVLGELKYGCGTKGYLPPEQDKKYFSLYSDSFSLGVVLANLLICPDSINYMQSKGVGSSQFKRFDASEYVAQEQYFLDPRHKWSPKSGVSEEQWNKHKEQIQFAYDCRMALFSKDKPLYAKVASLVTGLTEKKDTARLSVVEALKEWSSLVNTKALNERFCREMNICKPGEEQATVERFLQQAEANYAEVKRFLEPSENNYAKVERRSRRSQLLEVQRGIASSRRTVKQTDQAESKRSPADPQFVNPVFTAVKNIKAGDSVGLPAASRNKGADRGAALSKPKKRWLWCGKNSATHVSEVAPGECGPAPR